MFRWLNQIGRFKTNLLSLPSCVFKLRKGPLGNRALWLGLLSGASLATMPLRADDADQVESSSEGDQRFLTPERSQYYWVDVISFGVFDDYNVIGGQFNFTAKQKQWSAGVKYFDHFGIASYEKDRVSGEKIDNKLREFAVSRMWHRPSRNGYTSLSAGLSVLQGEIGTSCSRVNGESTSLFRRSWDECKRNEFTTLGIPLRASAGFGRYVGLAIHLDVNLNVEEPFGLISLSIPIGTFTR